ncbi:MAG TPA: hypothetical protein VKB50_06515 [Vicinamibacterales bacterium]|nr:hypothetical protein [Vicinamibacterales bacterium]
MAPLVVMMAAWIMSRSLGVAGVWKGADSWVASLRFALFVMFLFTAVTHFHPRTRNDLIRMVPPSLPAPGLLVSITGVFEVLGAIGLLVPQLSVAAAYGLIGLLAAMFPANIHAARARLDVAGRAATPLAWRLPLQLFWMGALWWVARAVPPA